MLDFGNMMGTGVEPLAVEGLVNMPYSIPNLRVDAALKDSTAAGLPAINVSPSQGKMLHLLARSQGARKILELGTLGGYSTIWMARALPDNGRLITLEYDPKHAEVARANIARAGIDFFCSHGQKRLDVSAAYAAIRTGYQRD